MTTMAPNYLYAATVERVIDGDTFKVCIDLGFRVQFRAPLRIYRFNAPELDTEEGIKAKVVATQLIASAKLITVRTRKAESYQRVVGDLYLDGTSIADLMVTAGHGVMVGRTK